VTQNLKLSGNFSRGNTSAVDSDCFNSKKISSLRLSIESPANARIKREHAEDQQVQHHTNEQSRAMLLCPMQAISNNQI
jgi:hypothetical protein